MSADHSSGGMPSWSFPQTVAQHLFIDLSNAVMLRTGICFSCADHNTNPLPQVEISPYALSDNIGETPPSPLSAGPPEAAEDLSMKRKGSLQRPVSRSCK